jgi:superfamily II DNA or RNA helicase
MRLKFDHGTLLLEGAPAGVDVADVPGFTWDARVGALRAPARLACALVAALRRRGVPLSDAPWPRLVPPSGLRQVTLRPYQHAALAAWRRAGRRGVVVLPKGAGKTRVALAAIAATRTPCLVLVPTRWLLAHWQEALAEIYDGLIGCLGGGLAPLTIATFADACRHMAVVGDRYGMLVVDEAHHFGTGAFDEALEMSIAPVRLGLTSTPPARGPAATRLAALLGPPLFELGAADLPGRHLAPLQHATWRLSLNEDERREYDALVATYREAVRLFMGSHLGASWEEFLREAARTEEGRRGIAAWRRAAQLVSSPRREREALARAHGTFW